MEKRKIGILSFVSGIGAVFIGIVTSNIEHTWDSYYKYSSSTQDIIEMLPMLFIVLGILGIISGIGLIISQISQDISYENKPIKNQTGKVLEKNPQGNYVYELLVEYTDGTRDTILLNNSMKESTDKISITIGDEGNFTIKDGCLINFTKFRKNN